MLDSKDKQLPRLAKILEDGTRATVAELFQKSDLNALTELTLNFFRGSIYDYLTGLLNSRGLYMILTKVIVPMVADRTTMSERRNASDRRQQQLANDRRQNYLPICVVSIDLDHFSRVNSQLGHAGGDKVLVAVAKLLKSSFRASDTIVRKGGDEFFAVLLSAPKEDVKLHLLKVKENLLKYDFGFRQENGEPLQLQITFTWDVIEVNTSEGLGVVLSDAMKRADEEMMRKKSKREE